MTLEGTHVINSFLETIVAERYKRPIDDRHNVKCLDVTTFFLGGNNYEG
jgi:hypothetical protein